MKIAVTYEDGKVFQHFGRTEQFKLYSTADEEIKSSELIGTNGRGHGMLADVLKQENVDTLICGGIGQGARNMLSAAGIRLFGGVSGSADEAVKALLAGKLEFNPDIQCNHHGEHEHGGCHGGHEHGHDCTCGEHKH